MDYSTQKQKELPKCHLPIDHKYELINIQDYISIFIL